MIKKNINPDYFLIKCKEITNNFENALSELILPARQLPTVEQDKIALELKATIQNINFMIATLSLTEESKES